MISQLGACHSGECWRHISYDYVQKTLIAYEFLWHRSARSNLLTFSRATAKSFTPISARAIDFHFNEPPGRISFTNGKSSQFHLALSNMSHPEFFEPTFDIRQAACQAGLPRAASPWPGVWGCAPLLSPSRAAAGGARKKREKEFFGDTPNPSRDAALPAPSLFEFLFQKFGMTHD